MMDAPANNSLENATSITTHAIAPYGEWFVFLLWLLTAIFSVETILGNLLVLLAYKLERGIRRQLSNKFIVSLAITDLIIGMEGFPMLTVYVVGQERWPLGQTLCQIWLCLDYTLCLVSILTVLLITVDRYGSVCYPAKYRTWQTNTRVRLFVVGSWIVPSLFFGLMIFAWDAMTGQGMDESGKCYAPFLNNPFVNMAMYIVYYWTTLVAVSVLYRGIHTAATTLEDKSKARERQTIALLLGQRCMAQVGVGMLLHSQAGDEMTIHEMPVLKRGGDGPVTEMVHDSGYMTTSATGTTHTNLSAGTFASAQGSEQRGSLIGQEHLTVAVPIIITQSPPSSVSISSAKVSPAPAASASVISSADVAPIQTGRLNEDEQNGSEECAPLVPIDGAEETNAEITSERKVSADCLPRNTVFDQTPWKRTSLPSSLIRYRLTPVHSLANSPKKSTTPHSASLNDKPHPQNAESNKRSYSLSERRRSSGRSLTRPKERRLFHKESGSSLDFYADSNCTSMSSIYGDASLQSVLEFDSLLSALDSVQSEDSSTSASTILGSNSWRYSGRNWKMNLSEFLDNEAQPKEEAAYDNRALMRTSSLTSSTWTRSSTSIRSQYSTQFDESHVGSEASSPAKKSFRHKDSMKLKNHRIDKFDGPFTCNDQHGDIGSAPVPQSVPASDSYLPPIIEEEKSTTTKPEGDLVSRRSSIAPSSIGSPPATKSEKGLMKRPQTPSDKIVHLTVPGQSAPGIGPPTSRKSSTSSTCRRRGTERDWGRASWQSTASSIYHAARRKTWRGTRAIDDEDDSEGREPGSSADDSPSDRKRSTGWLTTLFNNPVSILHRKRKVTKAEKRARKAFRTITVIVGTFALFWSPYYIVATLYGFCQNCVPSPLFWTSYYLCYLNSSVNPFAYAFANRLFRKTFLRILRGDLRRT